MPGILNVLAGVRGASASSKVLTYQTATYSNTDASSYTFSAQAIGTAASDRYVIVGVGNSNTTTDPTSVTVGGNSATKIASVTGGGAHNASLWIVLVTSGTTADIVVSGAGPNRCGIGVWSATGLTGTAANSSGTSTATNPTATLATLDGGFMVGFTHIGYPASGCTWTNGTERFDNNGESNTNYSGADATTTGANLAMTCTPSSSSISAGVFATW